MNSNKVFWGLLFLAVGVLWLLGNLGIISGDFWAEIWRLWPLLLILWGLSLLIGRESRASLVFSVISVVIVLGAIIGFGWLYNNQKILHSDTSRVSISESLEAGTSRGQLDLKFGAAKLYIGSGTDKFIEGEAETRGGVDISRSTSGATQKVEVDQVGGNPFFWGGRGRNEIELKLNDSIPFDLNLDTGASQFELDLSSIEVSGLEINGGATSGDIRLSDEADLSKVQISSGASSFDIEVPRGVGLRVDNKSGLSSINLKDFSLNKEGNIWQSPDYDTAAKKIEITFTAGASSINISTY